MPAHLAFLNGGGECGALIAARDWSTTSLGPIDSWPQSLKTATAILLLSPVPIVMLWNDDGVMIYNDAYSRFAGQRHPELLGSKVREGWPEVADFNDHVMKVGLAGGTLHYTDQELTLDRHGSPQPAWMDLDYSPVLGEDGRPAGVLAIVIETTERVLADRRVAAERDQQRNALQQMPGFAALLTGPDHRFDYVNDAYVALVGERDYGGRPIRDVLPDLAGQGFFELLDEVFASGEAHVARHVPVEINAEQRLVDFVYHPVRDPQGIVTGVFVGGYDMTDQVRSETALREAAERVQLALDAGAIIGTWVWHVPGDSFTADERFAHTFGLDAATCRNGL
ncbi:MAG: PAS domain-containing protein, partial [Sphingomonadaceae bacterium]|nr:PAS domain-containing protein [Sphingomonadaceae bacterium]